MNPSRTGAEVVLLRSYEEPETGPLEAGGMRVVWKGERQLWAITMARSGDVISSGHASRSQAAVLLAEMVERVGGKTTGKAA